MEALKADIRAKLTLRIAPKWGEDNWYEKWVAEVESATNGVMDVLNKYDIKERV